MPRINKPVRPAWLGKSEPKRNKEHDKFYDSPAWRRLSKKVAMEEPLCRTCKDNGIIKAGEVTDHILPRKLYPELSLERTNLQRLCNSCHAVKSAKEGKDMGGGVKS